MALINVTLYFNSKQENSLAVKSLLEEIKAEKPFNLILVDIEQDAVIYEKYNNLTPLVRIGPYTLRDQINRVNLEVALAAAADRVDRLKDIDEFGYHQRIKRGKKFLFTDRIAYWISRHYLLLFNTILALYVGLAFVAPVLMKAGNEPAARVLYTIYSPLCHQLAFRSWFIFGDQAYYPRDLAGISEITTYEAIAKIPPNSNERTDEFILGARDFLGDETAGFKVALCERDIAMYGSILIFGIIFYLTNKKMRPVPWYIWLVLGLFPIALDGLSQLPGLFPGMPDFFPNRESTPLFRTITGGLFGFLTAWYLYPFIDENMRETQAIMSSKKIVIAQMNQDATE